MSELRERYFHTLNFDESADDKLKAALDRAYEQRSFEIEHYWKRATYFWGFQVAIFAAFGLLWKAFGMAEWDPVTLALAGLGLLTAVANSITARGSKFWQQNWENHIDMLEDRIEGRLYKTVWLRDGGVSFSVTRVNARLNDCFIVFWFVIAAYVMWHFLEAPRPGWLSRNILREIYVASAIGLLLIAVWSLLRQKTELFGSFPIGNGGHGTPWRVSRRGRAGRHRKSIFIRRYAPDEHG